MKQSLSNNFKKIALFSSPKNEVALARKKYLIDKYNFTDFNKRQPPETELIIVLGGDGTMLHLLHEYKEFNSSFYGINCGTIGFLMNEISEDDLQNQDLLAKITDSHQSKIYPLKMTAIDENNKIFEDIAINEVSLIRQKSQAAKIKIKINDKIRLDHLSGDGVLVSTPAGSTAYNMSLRGPIIPIDSKILALTPISPFRPRNWHGAILPSNSKIEFVIVDHQKRPVSATADFIEVRRVKKVTIQEQKQLYFKLLFNADHSLEERIIMEQFAENHVK